jgi:BCD family chlorophyll transporter-like MFS transporter
VSAAAVLAAPPVVTAAPPAVGLRARDVVRLGLAQVAIGAVAALMLSTLNRVMVVELALPASVPSALVALHFAVQLSRARLGFASDRGRDAAGARRAPWVMGGAVCLGLGAVLAAAGTALAATHRAAGLLVCVVAYAAIGLGLSATGTALLAAAAERAAPAQLGRVAAGLWIMMIMGIVASAGITGALLDPFSLRRLVLVGAGVGVAAVALAAVAATGRALRADGRLRPGPTRRPPTCGAVPRRVACRRRRAGHAPLRRLRLPGDAGLQRPGSDPRAVRRARVRHDARRDHAVGRHAARRRAPRHARGRGAQRARRHAPRLGRGRLPRVGRGVRRPHADAALGSTAALTAAVFALGFANGVFTVGGVGAMMALTAPADAARGRSSEAGLRLGIFGAAQAAAYGIGGFAGGVASDVARLALGSPAAGYSAVFAGEAVLFAGAAWLALRSAPRERLGAVRVAERGADLVSVLS